MKYSSLSTKSKIKVQLENLRQNEELTYGGLRTLKIIEDLLKQLKEIEK